MAAVIAPAIAHADYRIVRGMPNADEQTFARQLVPARGAAAAVAQSKTVYLNRGGVTVLPGDNDARTNHSTLAKQPTQVPAWDVSDATWNATVACVEELFAPFDVAIVTADPGPVPHIEAVFGGTPAVLGMDRTIMGVAPFRSDCAVLENAIVFTFTANLPQDARLACEIQAQEIAHAYGLDHELLPTDPLTYMRYDGNRSFQNQLAACGETTPRGCGIAGAASCRSKQNSVQLLFERLGAKVVPGDDVDPTVAIISHAPGATVQPGFEIAIAAADNRRVTMATLYVDGVPSGSSSTAPWTLRAPATLAAGTRRLKVEVTDGRNTRSAELRVSVEGMAPAEDSDAGGCRTSPGAGLGFVLIALARVLRSRR